MFEPKKYEGRDQFEVTY